MIRSCGVEMLFKVGRDKFIYLAKDKNYREFIEYLENQPNFKIIHNMTELEKQRLYRLAKESE